MESRPGKIFQAANRATPFILTAVAAIILFIYIYNQGGNPPNSSILTDQLGTMGDFFGGMLNPILAFLAFIWLRKSVHIQQEELKGAKDALSQQQFDQSFFSLLEGLSSASAETKSTNPNFNTTWIVQLISKQSTFNEGLSVLQDNVFIIDKYLKRLNFILKYVAMHQNAHSSFPLTADFFSITVQESEKFYVEIVKSYIDQYDAIIIAFACHMKFMTSSDDIIEMNYPLLLELTNRYALLDCFDGRLEVCPSFIEAFKKFPPETFGSASRYEMILC